MISPWKHTRTRTHLQELNIDAEEVESLLVACILDSTVHGRIDQVNQILELDQEPQGSARCVQSVVTWREQKVMSESCDILVYKEQVFLTISSYSSLPDDNWNIQSKRQQVISQAQVADLSQFWHGNTHLGYPACSYICIDVSRTDKNGWLE